MTVQLGPIPPGERVEAFDAIRGFALVGVVLLNSLGLSGPYNTFGPWNVSTKWWDRTVELALAVGGEGAFYSIFSILFGVGFALQSDRAKRQGRSYVATHLVRMGVLFAFGVLHFVFLWDGDILAQYAVAGVLLLPFVRSQASSVANAATTLFMVVAFLFFATTTMTILSEPDPTVSASGWSTLHAPVTLVEHSQYFASGGFLELARARFGSMFLWQISLWVFAALYLSLFLAGVWFVRSGRFHDWERQRSFFVLLLKVVLPVAVVLKGLYAVLIVTDTRFEPLTVICAVVLGGPAQGLVYVCLLVLWWQRRSADIGWLRVLVPFGRMSLSNYLLASAISATIFYGFGFGLFDRYGSAAGLLITTVLLGMQIFVSIMWLGRFRFGPVEKLWRSLCFYAVSFPATRN